MGKSIQPQTFQSVQGFQQAPEENTTGSGTQQHLEMLKTCLSFLILSYLFLSFFFFSFLFFSFLFFSTVATERRLHANKYMQPHRHKQDIITMLGRVLGDSIFLSLTLPYTGHTLTQTSITASMQWPSQPPSLPCLQGV